jgi:hypothetical protein
MVWVKPLLSFNIEIHRDINKINIVSKAYIEKVLERFRIKDFALSVAIKRDQFNTD